MSGLITIEKNDLASLGKDLEVLVNLVNSKRYDAYNLSERRERDVFSFDKEEHGLNSKAAADIIKCNGKIEAYETVLQFLEGNDIIKRIKNILITDEMYNVDKGIYKDEFSVGERWVTFVLGKPIVGKNYRKFKLSGKDRYGITDDLVEIVFDKIFKSFKTKVNGVVIYESDVHCFVYNPTKAVVQLRDGAYSYVYKLLKVITRDGSRSTQILRYVLVNLFDKFRAWLLVNYVSGDNLEKDKKEKFEKAVELAKDTYSF